MCYHISFEIQLESITDYFPDVVIDPQLSLHAPAAYLNGFDLPPVRVMVKSRRDQKRHLPTMMWGFMPNYVKNLAEAKKLLRGYTDEKGVWHKPIITLNAIGGELFEKEMYRESALNRRCVIFIDGFYEWHHFFPVKNGKELKTPRKYPHYIFMKDNPYNFIMIAGIWTPWKHREVDLETGELLDVTTPCFAMCTTAASGKMEILHNSRKRMPTFLTKELAEEWIQDHLTEERVTQIATNQYLADKIDAHSIQKDFQQIANPKELQAYDDLAKIFC